MPDPGYSLGLFFGSGPNSVANWVNYKNKEVDVLLEQTLNTARPDDPPRAGPKGAQDHRGRCALGFLHRHWILHDRPIGGGGAQLARQQSHRLRGAVAEGLKERFCPKRLGRRNIPPPAESSGFYGSKFRHDKERMGVRDS